MRVLPHLCPPFSSTLVMLSAALLVGCSAPTPLLAESERGVDVGEELSPPVALARGGAVRVVRGNEPGESDLFIDHRALAPAPGPDELPLVLEGDAGVVFVSGRSGVASLWQVDLDGGDLVQLTNRGQRPGHLDAAFVPPPARDLRQDDDAVVYDDGSGRLWRVPLARAPRDTRTRAAGAEQAVRP